MWLKIVRLENIKCFEDTELIFTHHQSTSPSAKPHRRITLLGENGVGKRTSLRPLPRVVAIERALQRRQLTEPHCQPQHPNEPTAYYPLPMAQQANEVQSIDIVTRYVLGGERIYSFHLLDLATHYPYLGQYADKSAAKHEYEVAVNPFSGEKLTGAGHAPLVYAEDPRADVPAELQRHLAERIAGRDDVIVSGWLRYGGSTKS